jgi:hypothetical protein
MRHEPLARLLLHAKRIASYRGIEMVCGYRERFQATADATYPIVPPMEQSVVYANPQADFVRCRGCARLVRPVGSGSRRDDEYLIAPRISDASC